jgi:hypothetical protein
MPLPGESGSAGVETVPCTDDGPVDAGRAVVRAVECNSARFVDLARESAAEQPTTLMLTDANGDATPLSEPDVTRVPELRNAVAYFGLETTSIRVKTLSERSPMLREYVDSLRETPAAVFEFAGRQFDLRVVG